ncbi:MAG: FtsX-like permease family protein [Cyclobacteriaceae bacterium]
MKLKDSQIAFIEEDLHRRGITFDPLHEDLVDHICSEVEVQMARGVKFMDAYKLAVGRFQKRGLDELNSETVSILNSFNMIQNFLITIWRVFKRNMVYSAIRIGGLALGISVFIISLVYLRSEYSYDAFISEAGSIYRIGRTVEGAQIATTTFPLAQSLRNDYPDYTFTHFFKDRSRTLFRKEEKSFFEPGMIWADENFLTIFQFKSFIGNPATALKEPYTVVLTSQMGEKYLGRAPKLGDVIEFKWSEGFHPLKITGILPEWPSNMHIQFDFIISFATAESEFPADILNSWNMNYCYTYVKLPDNITPGQFENTFDGFAKKYVADTERPTSSYLGFLQPVMAIHLQPEVRAEYTNTINPVYPKLAVAVGFLVLLITGINFITLTIAQFHDRAKEIGVRKAIGASRRNVILQFVFETAALVTFSTLVGMALLFVFARLVNNYLGIDLNVSVSSLGGIFLGIPLLVLVLTLATGLYPAIFFSHQNILETIQYKKRRSGFSLRKLLLISQYLIASTLIIFCLVIYKQVDLVEHMDVGYDREQVVYIPHGRTIRDNPDVFKAKALESPAVESVSLSFYKPTDAVGNAIEVKSDGQEKIWIAATSVDEDFFETYHIDFVQGSNFERDGMDLEKVFILNESAVTALGLDEPIGATLETEFKTGDPNQPVEKRVGKVIGVVKDVHFESMHSAIKPMIFLVKPYWYFYINVRVNGKDVKGALAHLESTWSEMFPEFPFEYAFLDEEFSRLYKKEEQLASGLILMAGLALITTCLGLFGYIHFVTQQKTKEVGIRKVMGASMLQISNLFSQEFMGAIIIANVISWPVAFYVSNLWLQNFNYRIEMTVLPFVVTFVALVIISVLTVARELIQVMRIDPSKILRYD